MKMKKIISLLFIICTILVVAGCGSSKSKFEGTWYGLSNYNLYKIEITQNDKGEHLIKRYSSTFNNITNDFKNKISTDKWTGFHLDRQYIGTLHNENTLVINFKTIKKPLTINKNNEIEGYLQNINLVNSKKISEKDMIEKAKNEKIRHNKQSNFSTKFVE